MDGPCSVVHNGGMRGFNSSGSSSVFSSREQAHQQQAVRYGVGVAFAAPAAPATASSAAWDPNDEPLPDILCPPLRSVSSLVMSLDAEEGGVWTAARNNNNANTNTNTNNSSTNKNTSNSNTYGAAKDAAVSGAMGSKTLYMFMSSLPSPPTPSMDTDDQLTREQSFPPPFRTRLNRDQSFPPMDMLPSSSLNSGWAAVPTPTSNSNTSGGGSMVGGGGLFSGTGGAPSLSKFLGLGYPAPPLNWGGGPEQDDAPPGGQVHRGGGNGGPSLGNEGQHGVFYDPPPPPSHRQRHSSFDKLAEMIPGIPHWTTPSSPSTSAPPSAGPPAEAAREQLHGDGGAGGGGSNSSGSIKAEAADALTPASSPSRATPPTRGRQQHPTSSRPEKMKRQHQRRADSPPRARWPPSATSPPPAAAAVAERAITKRPQPSGTGKRSAEPPLSCGPVRPGGGPVDLAQQERRLVKIQRYLYKRSRRKFAKFTRDASPSRSRPKAAAKRPRVKGKFVKTVPDFVSVNDRHPREDTTGVAAADQQDAASPPSPQQSPAAGGVGVGVGAAVGGEGRRGGGGGGGGVRSVRNGGSVNVNFNGRKAFSSTPPSSLLPRGGGAGGGACVPPVSALAPHDGAPVTFLRQTDSMSMSM